MEICPERLEMRLKGMSLGSWAHCTVSQRYGSTVAQFSRLFVVLWTVAHQAPLSVGFPRQEYWNGVLFPTPRALPDPGMVPIFLVSPALAAVFQSLSRVQLCDPMDCSMPGFLVLHHPPEFVLHWQWVLYRNMMLCEYYRLQSVTVIRGLGKVGV